MLSMQEELKNATDENKYYKNTVESLSRGIEKSNVRYDDLNNDYDKLKEMY